MADIREKRVNEYYPVGFDFSAELGTNEEIASANVTCSNGLNSSGTPTISANNTQVSQYIYGGGAGNYYSVTIKATTNANNVFEKMFIIRVVSDTLPSAANTAIALIRLDEAKGYIGKVTDEDTAIIDQLINSVSIMFNVYTDRALANTAYANEEYDGNGKEVMWLKNYPITGNMTIYEDDILLTAGNDNDYLCYNNTGKLMRVNKTWYYGYKKILVTYNAGYVCTGNNITLPADIRYAALQQIAYEFERYLRKDWGLDSITYPDGSRSRMQTGLLKDVTDVLDKYRRRNL
jgi:hypothetical protein